MLREEVAARTDLFYDAARDGKRVFKFGRIALMQMAEAPDLADLIRCHVNCLRQYSGKAAPQACSGLVPEAIAPLTRYQIQ